MTRPGDDVRTAVAGALFDRARARLAGGMGGAPPPASGSTPAPGPTRALRFRLPDGRTVPVRVTPAVARHADVAALARAQEELTRKVAELQARSDLALLGVAHSLAGLRRQVQTTASTQAKTLATRDRSLRLQTLRQRKQLRTQAAVQGRVEQIRRLNAAASTMQSAAYGQKGELVSRNNLLLAGNQLLWSYIDPILERLGLWSGPWPSPIAWVSPLASLLAGRLTVGRFQHVRFVSGVATFDGTTRTRHISLADRIGAADFPGLRRRTDLPVTLTQLDGPKASVDGQVRNGTLVIQFAIGTSMPVGRVAWTVDTGLGNV